MAVSALSGLLGSGIIRPAMRHKATFRSLPELALSASVFAFADTVIAASDSATSNVAESAVAALVAAAPASSAAVRATPVFGGGLSLPQVSFLPMVALPGWTFRGASGGVDPDADGWRPFRVRTTNDETGPILEGGVRFDHAENGAVHGRWRFIPTLNANVLESFVGGALQGSVIAGGTATVDGRTIKIALDGEKPHLFRGAVRELAFADRNGSEVLRVAFDRPTRILLQDGAAWGGTDLTIRFFFKEGPLAGGAEYEIGATFSTPGAGPLALSGDGSVVLKAGDDWIPFVFDPWIEKGSALDFSDILPHDAPAGKHGRVVAVDGHFEFEGLPGVPQRFYGVNLCGDANLPSSPEAADRFVANISRIGYNALRIHHHERTLLHKDARFVPGLDDTVPNPARMAMFDDLVASAVEHGVYLTTDLFVSRSHMTPWRHLGIDRDGCISNTGEFKVLCAFWEPAYSNLCAWTRNFLGHVNPRTGRSLAEEPALACLALVNEGNLGNWGGAFLRDIPGVREAWEAWLAERSGKPEFAGVTPEIPESLNGGDGQTPENRQIAAFSIFLAERETALFDRLAAFVREECGCQAPLSSLSSWFNPVQYQLPRTRFDYVDEHFYVDHPKFLDRSWKLPSSCPNVNPVCGSPMAARGVEWRRLMDKPFCITEWNYSGPGRFRGVGGIATGALAALQDWSGMWRFAWSHGRGGVERPETKTLGYFDMSGDPLGLAAERATLCLFLRRDLEPLPAEYPLVLDAKSLLDPRCGSPKCELTTGLWAGWFARVGSRVEPAGEAAKVAGPTATIGSSQKKIEDDLAALGAEKCAGGAISIDKATGTFLIDTPRTAGGFAESGSHRAGPLSFTLRSAPATVWASSLDDRPISESSRVLLTHLTDVQNSNIRYGDPDLKILLDWGRLPHIARRGTADIALAMSQPESGSAQTPVVYRLDTAGRRLGEVPATFENGVLRFEARTDIDRSAATMLYEIVRR